MISRFLSKFVLGIAGIFLVVACVQVFLNSHQNALEVSVNPSPTVLEKYAIYEGEIKPNTAIFDELLKYGLSGEEVLLLFNSFKGVFDFRYAKPSDTYKLFVDPEEKIHKFIFQTSPVDVYFAVRTTANVFSTYKDLVEVKKEIMAKTFTIESSLFEAVLAQGEKDYLVMEFADIFSWDIDFYLYPQKGDKIEMMYEKYFSKGTFLKYGNILVAKYRSPRKTFEAYRYQTGKNIAFFDPDGYPMRKMFLRQPLKFGVRTSGFTIRRFHPVLKRVRAHTGIDYGANFGTPIMATAKGTVSHAGWYGGYGKLVVIRHGNNYKTYYGHCQRIFVRKGQSIKQGQILARVGSTGLSTGPHVHYEVRINNQPINPNRVKAQRQARLTGPAMALFSVFLSEQEIQLAQLLNPKPVLAKESRPSFWERIVQSVF